MQVRPLRQEEMPLLAKYIRDAFVRPPDFADQWMQLVKAEATRGIFDDQGKLLAGLRLYDNDLWLGARKVRMLGVTNVATPPEHRRQGVLKQLLTTILHQERENGFNTSGLYPFDFGFYRKFGYEQASSLLDIKVKLAGMAHFKSREAGHWEQCSAEDWPRFQALYNRFCVGRFGRIERTDVEWWRRRVFSLWGDLQKPLVAYLWNDAQGQPQAYLLYWFKTLPGPDGEREMNVQEMVWLDEAARHEIYAFIANHDSQALEAIWPTEPGDEFFARLPDPRQAKLELQPGYMLRLLDVARALEERAWPETSAALSIAVEDDVLAWNHHRTYRLEVAHGQAEVSTTTGPEQAGLVCDVRTLAQLFAGYLSPWDAARLGKLTVQRRQDLDTAQQLFSPPGQPAAFMADFW